MKIRASFISNSSSSSFILLGILRNEKELTELFGEDFYDKLESMPIDFINIDGEDKYIIGKSLSYTSDDDEVDFKVHDIVREIGETNKKLSYNFKLHFDEVKLYSGTTQC